MEFDRSRSGVRVRTSFELRRTVSSVLISHVQPADSGAYYCDPDGLEHAKVTLHVLAGESVTSVNADRTGGGLMRWQMWMCSPMKTIGVIH